MSQKILVIYSKPSQCHIQRFINIVKYDRYTNRKGERQVEDKNSVIVFKNVSFQYQSDASFTLKDVSFNIPKGQWTSIVGHNGSGKSTIAKLMIGIEKVKSGEIFYNNQAITDDNFEKLRKDIGIVFQNPDNQFVGSIVKYDVAFGLENHAVPHDEMHRRVSEALKQVDMLERADYEPNALSGGQKQRVAIASVLALNPSVIILDEATSMLDPDARQNLLDLVRKVKSEHNITIISITHDLSEAMEANHVIVMNKGTVYKEGTAIEIFDHAEELTTIGLDLPFPIKINQMLGHQTSFLTYEGLVDQL
ncbi:ATP-binding ABC transporter [Staphylococcus aureus O46]|nr:ATP-binding ABC transporter [Staphylococcus aureus O46]QCA27358.1 Atp-binding abc transporter [Staphylococcus aureus]